MAGILERLPGPRLGRIVRVVLVVVGVAPVLTPFLARVPGVGALALPFSWWFDFQCHREIGRSFELFGQVLPVCSRCFGIYAGLGFGAAVLRPRLGVWPLRIWVAVGALAMVADVLSENHGLRPASGWLRFATGCFLSYPVGAALVVAARGEAEG